MIQRTNILLALAGQTGLTNGTGQWYQVPADDRTHNIVSVAITAGTGTVVIEGRIDANSQPVTITTISATDAQLVAKFPQIRARLTAATGLTVEAQIDKPCTQAS